MGVIVHKETEKHTELNDRIAADLRARAQQSSNITDPDLVESTDYVKDLKKTSRYSWIWFVLILIGITILIFAFVVKPS